MSNSAVSFVALLRMLSCCGGASCLGQFILPTTHLGIKVKLCNSYTMGCPPVRGDNPRALASGLKKNLTKMLLIKSNCPMWTHPWLKMKWERLLNEMQQNATCCVHFRMWNHHMKQLGQGKIGYTMFCVPYEIYTRELRSLVYIP